VQKAQFSGVACQRENALLSYKKVILEKRKKIDNVWIIFQTNAGTMGKSFARSNFIQHLLEKCRSAQPKVFANL